MSIDESKLLTLANNPMRGLNNIIDEIERTWFGGSVKINAGSHPVVFCSTLTTGIGAGFLNALRDEISVKFPEHARSIKELSCNMNSEEYYGLFGNPSAGTVIFVIATVNLINYAVQATDDNGNPLPYKMLLIPKDTVFSVNGYEFSIENGIEIRYNERTGIQVVYDSATNNPFNLIQANILTRKIEEVEGREYLQVSIPCRQLSCAPYENISSTKSAGVSSRVTYSDILYGVRAFITRSDGVKRELAISYDGSVFDRLTPTLVVDLDTSENAFDYSIPDVYIENELGIGTISIYVYTTKGPLEKDFTKTDTRDYATIYSDYRYGAGKLNKYSAPLENMGGIVWKFDSTISGGTTPRSFSQIRYGVVSGKRQRKMVITENNLQGTVQEFGYSSVKTIDYVSSRLYALTKELPLQENKGFFSGVNCLVGSNLVSIKDLVQAGIVFDNGQRVTLPSGCVLDVTKQVPVLLNRLQITQMSRLTNEQLVAAFENNTYAYLPYHYVFDTTNNQVTLRSYYMDNPTVQVQSFKGENEKLGIEVGIDALRIEYKEDGYTLYAQTASGESFRSLMDDDVSIQLSCSVDGSVRYASVKGELAYKTVAGERVYRFDLKSRFDISATDKLTFTNMSRYDGFQDATPLNLNEDIIFIVMVKSGAWNTVIAADAIIDRNLYPTPMAAIIQTNFNVTFGQRLTYLYGRIRPLIGEAQYQRYEQDVPETYAEDEFQYNGTELAIDPDTNLPIRLHRKGEVKYAPNGSVIVKHERNSYMKDAQGNFIEVVPKELKFHWDFLAFDGTYRYSKDPYDTQFAQYVKDYLLNTTSKDLELFSKAVLDQTRMLFQPRSKLGFNTVVVNSNYESIIKQDLSFEVTYYLSYSGANDANLKKSLKANTPKVLNNALYGRATISTDGLVKALSADLPEQVVGVKVNAIAGLISIDVISNKDDLTGFSIRKLLALGDDKKPTIIEDVKVDFLIHDASRLTY